MSKSPKTVPGEMTDMDVRFVSLVRKGANRQTIQIYKADDDESEAAGSAQSAKPTLRERIMAVLKLDDEDNGAVVSAPAEKQTAPYKSFAARVALKDLTERMWSVNSALSDTLRDIINSPQVKDKKSAMNTAVDEFSTYMKNRIAGVDGTPITKADGFFDAPIEVEKSGRVLSAKSVAAIRQAVAALQSMLADADGGAESGTENNPVKKEESDMNKEDITKAVSEALEPINKRLETLEKAAAPAPADNSTEPAAAEPQQTDTDIIKAAVADALAPISERLERIEKSRGMSRSAEADEPQTVEKGDGDSAFDGYFI